jgi:hypothetical protein
MSENAHVCENDALPYTPPVTQTESPLPAAATAFCAAVTPVTVVVQDPPPLGAVTGPTAALAATALPTSFVTVTATVIFCPTSEAAKTSVAPVVPSDQR